MAYDAQTRRAVTRPMKGTRPAGADPAELRDAVKDRAELNMIVDLMRNDLGRVCRFGTVSVADPRAIEPHGTVIQAVATVAGERMLTDLRHLGELLQEAWTACGGGERLLAWFARQAAGDADDEDAREARALRLESDAERVRLMTLHASKGLEFNVVLLPLMWKHGRAGLAAWSAQLLADADGVRQIVRLRDPLMLPSPP